MRRPRTEKPLRTPIYLTDEGRAERLQRLREYMGAGSDSEAVRRLIDYACLMFELLEAGQARAVFTLLQRLARRHR